MFQIKKKRNANDNWKKSFNIKEYFIRIKQQKGRQKIYKRGFFLPWAAGQIIPNIQKVSL